MFSISVDGLSEAGQREQVEWFVTAVAPVLRRELPSTIWSQATPTAGQDVASFSLGHFQPASA